MSEKLQNLVEEISECYSDYDLDRAIASIKKYGRPDGRILMKYVTNQVKTEIEAMTREEKVIAVAHAMNKNN
jgi:hypothetical protein